MCCGDNNRLIGICGWTFDMSRGASQPAIADNGANGSHSIGLSLAPLLGAQDQTLIFDTVFRIAITEYRGLSKAR